MAKQAGTPWWAHLLALAFILFGGFVELYTVNLFLETRRMTEWPLAAGTIVQSKVSWVALRATPDIAFEYEVGGTKFRSTKIRPRGPAKGEANTLVDRYRVGANVPVKYDPANPATGYLEADIDFVSYLIIVSPLIFVGLGVMHFVSHFRGEHGLAENGPSEAGPPGTSVTIDCPACGRQGVSAIAQDEVPEFARNSEVWQSEGFRRTFVVCGECGRTLLSTISASQLAELRPGETHGELSVYHSFLSRLFAILALLFGIVPVFGPAIAITAIYFNRRSTSRLVISGIGLTLGVFVHLKLWGLL